MGDWARYTHWEGAGRRRSTSFFPSGRDRLFASLTSPSGEPFARALVVPSWGFEHEWLLPFSHDLATRASSNGTTTMVWHAPGHGESSGDAGWVSAIAGAIPHAAAFLDEHASTPLRAIVAIRLGAAAVLTSRVDVSLPLLLVEPVLTPEATLRRWRARTSARAAGGFDAQPGWLYSYALPFPSETAVDDEVASRLAAWRGPVAVARYASGATPLEATVMHTTTVPGRWTDGPNAHRRLAMAASSALQEILR